MGDIVGSYEQLSIEEYVARFPDDGLTHLSGTIRRVIQENGVVKRFVFELKPGPEYLEDRPLGSIMIELPSESQGGRTFRLDDLNCGDELSVELTGACTPYGFYHMANLTSGHVYERRVV